MLESASGAAIALEDGTTLSAANIVVGVGTVPNNGWLRGLALAHCGGVPCDKFGRAAENVWAVGDVAAWEDERYGDRFRHEHWTRATEQASVVASARS